MVVKNKDSAKSKNSVAKSKKVVAKSKKVANAERSENIENIENILCIDPAINTGWCVIAHNLKNNTADIFAEGDIRIDTTSEYVGDLCINFMDQIKNLIETYNVSHLTVEDYFFSKRFATGSSLNVELRTAIYILARTLGLTYTILNISAWKTFVAGRATPTKEHKRKWGAEAAKKLYIQEALYKKYGFIFPNFSLSPKTNKPVAFRMDVVDAVAQGVYYCRMIRGITEVTRSVEVPEPHTFRSPPKKCYVYD